MNDVWVFQKGNTRLLRIDDDHLDLFQNREDVLINPDVSHLTGVPPHYWKINENKRIDAMTKEERRSVERRLNAMDKVVKVRQIVVHNKLGHNLALIGSGIVLDIVIHFLFRLIGFRM